MRNYLTPGVYFENPRRQPAPVMQRTDVAGFVGLALRGPLHQPQRLTTWREFQQVFGGFLPYSHLAYAVRAFFENGGQVCWVVRVADVHTAQPAALAIPDLRAMERDLVNGDPPRTFAYHVTAVDPGTWGQSLEISLQAAGLAATQHVVLTDALGAVLALPADTLALADTAGLEIGSRVQLTQDVGGAPLSLRRRVVQVDVVRGVVRLDTAPAPLNATDSSHAISLESLEFRLLVWENGQVVERFDNLAPDEAHSRYAVDRVNERSRYIRLARALGDSLPALPWRGGLQGGANGLRSMSIFDSIGTPQGDVYGLAALAAVEEIGLLAMPDLTARPATPKPIRREVRRRVDPCIPIRQPERVTLTGRVLDAEAGHPVSDVEVNDGLDSVRTDSDGRFSLPDIPAGTVELTFSRREYNEMVLPFPVGSAANQDLGLIRLSALDLPPGLSDEDIFYGQAAMIAQCTALRNRFALLDPPLSAAGTILNTSGLQTWRARFDTAFAGLYYPWLIVRDQLDISRLRYVPPSGHVAGVYAATDRSEGVFRPPANRALAFVDDVGVPVDEATQAVLNPRGINCIRAFPGRGIRLYGARTMSSDSAWRFVNVRRLMSMLETALHQGLQWAVFEPNDVQLQLGLRSAITSMLDELWRRGAFVGNTPEAAYNVRCDEATTPPEAQAEGRIIVHVLVAPTVPYEFVVLRLGLTTDELQISEV
ncbi:MAG: hypothetical protein HC822_21995 [Oscillochloris sp.]|nr:hypothetical protein [Oscillochloris sp.]